MTASSAIRLRLKVVPKAADNRIVGWIGDSLKVRVRAAPERGKANAAVLDLLATALDVKRERIQLVAGQSSARKTVEILGLTEAELQKRLRPAAGVFKAKS